MVSVTSVRSLVELFDRIDNFLPKDVFECMEDFLMDGRTDNGIKWSYKEAMSHEDDTDGFLFDNVILNGHFKCQDLFLRVGVPIISRIPMKELYRIKINCHPHQHNRPKSAFHTDDTEPHKTAIFMINSCDGYTEFEDGTKLDSVRNTLYIFDGSILHRSVGQTDSKIRININVNFN